MTSSSLRLYPNGNDVTNHMAAWLKSANFPLHTDCIKIIVTRFLGDLHVKDLMTSRIIWLYLLLIGSHMPKFTQKIIVTKSYMVKAYNIFERFGGKFEILMGNRNIILENRTASQFLWREVWIFENRQKSIIFPFTHGLPKIIVTEKPSPLSLRLVTGLFVENPLTCKSAKSLSLAAILHY